MRGNTAPEPEPEPQAPQPVADVDSPAPVATAETPPPESEAPEPVAEPEATPEQTPAPPAPSGSVSAETIRAGWPALLDAQSTKVKARFRSGEVAGLDGDVVQFVVTSDMALKRCADYTRQIEDAMSASFGTPLTIALSVGTGGSQQSSPRSVSQAEPPPHESEVDIHDLTDADVVNASAAERIAEVFPGAEIIEKEN